MIPNTGRAMLMRNRTTGAMWSVSYDYTLHVYHYQPLGNLSLIRDAYDSPTLTKNLELSGTFPGDGFKRMLEKRKVALQSGTHRQNHTGSHRLLLS